MIPRTIHAIWVGSPPPDWVQRRWGLWRSWCEENRITFRAWTDAEVSRLPVTSQLPELPHPVVLADFARVEIVDLYGGMYVDSDSVPLPGAQVDDLFGERKGWVSRLMMPAHEISNGAFAFAPADAYLRRVWNAGVQRLGRGYKRMSSIIGPGVWTAALEGYEDEVDVLAADRFYTSMDTTRRTLEELAVRHPGALMVHEFEQSWQHGYDGHGIHKPMPRWERRMITSKER